MKCKDCKRIIKSDLGLGGMCEDCWEFFQMECDRQEARREREKVVVGDIHQRASCQEELAYMQENGW